jgi:hypothetical protein
VLYGGPKAALKRKARLVAIHKFAGRDSDARECVVTGRRPDRRADLRTERLKRRGRGEFPVHALDLC